MDILSCLSDPAQWQRFYEHKINNDRLSKQDSAALAAFVESEGYLPYVEKILAGQPFSPPRRAVISKMHSEKKRTVYIYTQEESFVLKFITYLLQRKYDRLFAPNLYSFRPGIGVRNAISDLIRTPGLSEMWSYKTDISNYFNTVPVERLLPILKQALADEPVVYRFLAGILTDPRVNDRNTVIEEEKGIMAGTPISTFLANLYLNKMDWQFADKGSLYARYSDDIILFAPTREQLERDIARIHETLSNAGLSINPDKEQYAAPRESWVYLGISYHNGTVDVAPASIEKLKAKMRRKARALSRWKARKNAAGTSAAKAFIRVFNRKLFENPVDHELTWTRWYFPLINTADSLRVIDQYSQNCIRYLATGKRTKSAYGFRYEDMKALGYVSLVNCYYSHRRSDNNLEETVD